MKNPYQGVEEKIMNNLASAWNLLLTLEPTHPSHKQDFCDGIHKAQSVIMNRVLQRDYPETFPTHKQPKKGSTNG